MHQTPRKQPVNTTDFISHIREVPVEQHRIGKSCAVLQSHVRFHVVPPRERLPTQRAEIRLGPVYGGMVPPVADRLAAYAARVQSGRLRYFVEQIAIVLGGRGVVVAVLVKRAVGGFLILVVVVVVVAVGRMVAVSLFPPYSWNRESQPSPSRTGKRGGCQRGISAGARNPQNRFLG